MLLVPSAKVDEVWHSHILFTKAYEQDCKRVFGAFFHHKPTVSEDDKAANAEAYTRMLEVYSKHFDAVPDADVWPRCTAKSCMNGCGGKCGGCNCNAV